MREYDKDKEDIKDSLLVLDWTTTICMILAILALLLYYICGPSEYVNTNNQPTVSGSAITSSAVEPN
jgi:hypothetical protein